MRVVSYKRTFTIPTISLILSSILPWESLAGDNVRNTHRRSKRCISTGMTGRQGISYIHHNHEFSYDVYCDEIFNRHCNYIHQKLLLFRGGGRFGPNNPKSSNNRKLSDRGELDPRAMDYYYISNQERIDQYNPYHGSIDDDDDDDSTSSADTVQVISSTRDSTGSNRNNDVAMAARAITPVRSPIVYRFFGRQKTRDASSGSIPFILIGPSVDHWKVTGQQLGSRGFNVIAVGPKEDSKSIEVRRHEGAGLVLQLMDALRWNHRVVLVGCDNEAALAIHAAMVLAPERVAGLILCGNLDQQILLPPQHLVATTITKSNDNKQDQTIGPYYLDKYLEERLRCPFTIIWDGDASRLLPATTLASPSLGLSPQPKTSSSASAASAKSSSESSFVPDLSQKHRTVIIGGGTAPHRRRPEIFAWILTRFVEENIAPQVKVEAIPTTVMRRSQQQQQRRRGENPRTGLSSQQQSWRYPSIDLPWRVDEMFNEESMVVFGRVVATAIFYAVALKVIFYHYDNFRIGLDFLTSLKRNTVQIIRTQISKIISSIFFFRRIPKLLTNILRRGNDNSIAARKSSSSPKDNEASSSSSSPDGVEGGEELDDDDNNKDPNSIIEGDGEEAADVPPEPNEKNQTPMFFLDHVVA